MEQRTNFIQPFGLFRCPRCGHFQRHAGILMKGLHSYNWCGKCTSYFRLKNEIAWVVLWGVIASVIGLPLAWFVGGVSEGPGMMGVGLIVVGCFAMIVAAVIARRVLPWKFEYVGKDAP